MSVMALQTSEHSAFTPTHKSASSPHHHQPSSSDDMEGAEDAECMSPSSASSPPNPLSSTRTFVSGGLLHSTPHAHRQRAAFHHHHGHHRRLHSSLNSSSTSSRQSPHSPSPPSSPDSATSSSREYGLDMTSAASRRRRSRSPGMEHSAVGRLERPAASPEETGSGKENDRLSPPSSNNNNAGSGSGKGNVNNNNAGGAGGQKFTSFSVLDILAQPSKKQQQQQQQEEEQERTTPPSSPSPQLSDSHPHHHHLHEQLSPCSAASSSPELSPRSAASTAASVLPMRVGLRGLGVGVGALADTRWAGNQGQPHPASLSGWYLGAPRFSATASKF
jgi:hypothetical protein